MGGLSVLLDTHAVLWALTDPAKLGEVARESIRDPQTRLHVSAASAWELSTKSRLGKLPGIGPLLFSWHRHLAQLGAQELPMQSDHALLAGTLEWEHRDPFDRMLAAQSLVEGLRLVTRDARFGGLPGLRVLW